MYKIIFFSKPSNISPTIIFFMFFFIIKRPTKLKASSVKKVFVRGKKKFSSIGSPKVRNSTTLLLNEIGIKDKAERASIHKSVQFWKKTQLDSFYKTGKATTEGKAKEAFEKMKRSFKSQMQFYRFIERLTQLTKEASTQLKRIEK